MGVYRHGRERPSYDSDVIFIRRNLGLGEQRGRGAVPRAWRVRLTSTEARPDLPSSAPPSSGRAAPAPDGAWAAWWPTPMIQDSTYQMPDPPEIDPPVLPDAANPFLWAVRGEVKASSTWELPTIQGIHVAADVKDLAATETIIDRTELSITRTSIVVQSASLDSVMDESDAPFAKQWYARLRGVNREIEQALEMQDGRQWRIIVADRR